MRFHEQGILRVSTADLTEHAALYRLYRLIAERAVSGEYIVGNISGKPDGLSIARIFCVSDKI